MPRRRPALRALLVASVAAGSLPQESFAAPRPQPGDRFHPLHAAEQGQLPVPEPDGQQADDVAGEPVTREYERYAQNDPSALAVPPSTVSSGVIPVDGPSILSPYARVPAPVRPTQFQTAQIGPAPNFGGSNPFRNPESLTPDEPSAQSTVRSSPGNVTPVAPGDPLTADIDRDIRQVSADLAPHLDASVSLRGRSGVTGLGQLFDLEAPIEASFSPGGYGRLRVVVTPTVLGAGHTNAANTRLFGTNPLAASAAAVSPGHTSTAGGAGLDVGYAYNIVSADLGSTPLGFRQPNVIGGIEVTPRITNNLLVRVTAERRAVTDSTLSYAGLRDPRSGEAWGGVTRNRGRVQIEGAADTVTYYASAGYAGLYGQNVKDNTEVEAGAGFSLPVYTTPTQEVRTGLNLVYFGYAHNLGNFTFGSGGYFSPQQFFAALIPVSYRQQLTPDLVYTVGASIGVQTFRAKGSPVFPNNPALQAQLAASSATTGVGAQLGGFHSIGPGGGANGEIDYRVNDNLHVGAKAGFDRSGNFTEGTGLVYARYVFNDPS